MDDLGSFALAAGAMSLALAWGWRAHARQLGVVAEALGLRRAWGPAGLRAEGRHEGLAVELRQTFTELPADKGLAGLGRRRRRVPRSVVRVEVEGGLPEGLHVHHEGLADVIVTTIGGQDVELGDFGLDHALRIRGADEGAVRALLDDEAVRAGLRQLVDGQAGSCVRDGRVVLAGEGHRVEDVRALLHRAASLARALAASRDRPWLELARRHGLRAERQPAGMRLDGEVGGLALSLREARGEGRPRVELRARLHVPLPRALRVLRRTGEESGPGLRLGDPVLDGALHVHAADEAGARRLLCRDAVRGELLAAVHGWPSARIVAGTLVMPDVDPAPEAVARALDDALGLGRALEEAARTGEPDPGR